MAVDGATSKLALQQYDQLPKDTTHIVLSVGGNDALSMSLELFAAPTSGVRDSLEKLGHQANQFCINYGKLTTKLRSLQLPLTVCTVYDSVPGLTFAEKAGLSAFNDVITKTAIQNSIQMIDLRVICSDEKDYSEVSSIEPSSIGGQKIAQAIANAIGSEQPLIVG